MGKKKKNKKEKKTKVLSKEKLVNQYKLSSRQTILLFGILIATLIFFYPVFDAEFVNWDDDKNFSENILITSLNQDNFWLNVKEIFVTPVIGNYNPLPIFTFALEQKIFGLDQPVYWHLNNLILHLLCIVLVFLIGRRMKLSTAATVLLAGLFAIHPMRVESVAWITERKDVLFGVFYLWGMLLYLKNLQDGHKWSRTILIFIVFILSLFSKIQAVIFPVSLVLIDYWWTSKLTFKQFLTKSHLFLGSLAFGLLGIYFLQSEGSLESSTSYSGFQRIFIGSTSYLAYLVKSIVPYRLSPLYPYPAEFPPIYYATILSFIGGGAALLWSFFKQKKHIFFGLAFFTANVFFLLQIKAAGQGFMADRFTYIAYFGLFYLFAFGYDQIKERLSNPIKYGLIAGILLIYGIMTFQQTKVWKNSGTLWTHVIKYHKNTTLPYGNRANYYRDIGETDKALADYSMTISLKPDEPGPYNSRARLYFSNGSEADLKRALTEYTLAIERDPNTGEYYANRGATYARLNRLEEGIKDLNKAIEIDPDFLNTYLNRSVIYNQMGNIDGALSDLQHYLKYRPYQEDLWFEAGRLLNLKNNYTEALPKFNQAISLNPNNGKFYIERAKANFSTGNLTEAQNDLNTAKRLGAEIPETIWNIIMNGQGG